MEYWNQCHTGTSLVLAHILGFIIRILYNYHIVSTVP